MKAASRVDPDIDAQIRHLIAQYAWALDTADLATLAMLFVDDCVVQDTSGARHEGRDAAMAYFRKLTATPVFRGRRHHIDNVVNLTCGDVCDTRAYWVVEKWNTAAGIKAIEVVGHSEDRYVRTADGFRFAERILHYWRDADGPWAAATP